MRDPLTLAINCVSAVGGSKTYRTTGTWSHGLTVTLPTYVPAGKPPDLAVTVKPLPENAALSQSPPDRVETETCVPPGAG